MPAGTKVAAAEKGLTASANKKHLKGKRRAAYIYGRLNSIGFMHGNKPTTQGLKPARTALS